MKIEEKHDVYIEEMRDITGKPVLDPITGKPMRILKSGLEELIMESTTVHILKTIKDYQDKNPDDEGITKEEIARNLDKAGILSRPTTLKIIQRLLDYEVILDNKKRDNSYSRLIVHPRFNFDVLEENVLVSHIREIAKQFEPFTKETKGVNTVLIHDLLTTIGNFRLKLEPYSPKQMEKINLDLEKKIVKQTRERLMDNAYKKKAS